MRIAISDLLDAFPEISLADNQTIPTGVVTNIASPTSCGVGSLVFVDDHAQLDEVLRRGASAVVVKSLKDGSVATQASTVMLLSENPRLSMARVRRHFDDYQGGKNGWTGTHPSATVHPGATIGTDCLIGPGVVVGDGAVIGNHCQIDSHAVIEHGVTVGHRSHLQARVFIGYRCEIGDDVIVRPGAVIGGEGFGLVPNESGRYERMPHTGRVVIHNDVIIGAQCNIDRGTLDDTIIEKGARLDALVHLAHNVHIGEEALVLAQCAIAGSSRIGRRAILSGQCGVIDHKTVAAEAVLLHRAGVVRDIETPGQYAGNPAIPLREYLRSTKLAQQLDRLKQRVRALERESN